MKTCVTVLSSCLSGPLPALYLSSVTGSNWVSLTLSFICANNHRFSLLFYSLLFVVVMGQGKISVIVDDVAKHDCTGGWCVCTILVSLWCVISCWRQTHWLVFTLDTTQSMYNFHRGWGWRLEHTDDTDAKWRKTWGKHILYIVLTLT